MSMAEAEASSRTDTERDNLRNRKRNLYILSDDPCTAGEFPNEYLQCTIISTDDLSEVKLCLKDCWAKKQIFFEGSYIGIVGVEKDENNCITVDGEHGFVILEPDKLVSMNSITDRFCERKTVLASKLRFSVSNEAMLIRLIGREMFAVSMLLDEEKRSDVNLFQSVVRIASRVTKTPSVMCQAYGLGVEHSKLDIAAREWIIFVLRYLRLTYSGKRAHGQSLKIDSVADIEECVWNPVFGIKGKIDATVDVTFPGEMNMRKKVPIEFKCGTYTDPEWKTDHEAQIQLYCLLMNQRSMKVTNGLMYYPKPDRLVETKIDRKIISPLVMSRNRIVLAEKIENGAFVNIPRPVVNPDACKNCDYRTTCALITRTTPFPSLEHYRNDTEETNVQSITYLRREYLAFFKSWFTVITSELEMVEKRNDVKRLWTVPVAEREESGCCVGHMIFHSSIPVDYLGSEGIMAYFIRDTKFPFDFSKVNFLCCEVLVISCEEQYGITYGIVQELTHNRITVKLDKSYSYFTKCSNPKMGPRLTFDKIQEVSSLSVQYEFLHNLMQNNLRASRLRKYLIDRHPVTFSDECLDNIFEHEAFHKFSAAQREVIQQAIRTDSFLFVKGMAGTGKTRTITGIIRCLLDRKKTVLLTAQTRCGLDSILHQCLAEDINCFIRLGHPKVSSSALLQRWEKIMTYFSSNYEKYKIMLDELPIVAATIFGLNHDLFRRRRFDYVIIDEASQLLPCAVIGALQLADKYIILGDSCQVPSSMQNSTVKERSLPDSLFSMMATNDNTKYLSHQYRMAWPIMDLSNKLVYHGQMTSNRLAASGTLELMVVRDVSDFCQASKLNIIQAAMGILLSRNPDDALVFLDVESFETRVAKNTLNEKETQVTRAVCQMYIQLGVKPYDVAVFAPCRSHLNAVRIALDVGLTRGIHVNTVDVFLGLEKEIVICTFATTVPCNMTSDRDTGGDDLLEDIRLLNIAITRARKKLILIGCVQALKTYKPFEKLFDVLPACRIIKIS